MGGGGGHPSLFWHGHPYSGNLFCRATLHWDGWGPLTLSGPPALLGPVTSRRDAVMAPSVLG